jgi:hypothetical protein
MRATTMPDKRVSEGAGGEGEGRCTTLRFVDDVGCCVEEVAFLRGVLACGYWIGRNQMEEKGKYAP